MKREIIKKDSGILPKDETMLSKQKTLDSVRDYIITAQKQIDKGRVVQGIES